EESERAALLALLEPSEIGKLVQNLETDDAADVIEELDPQEQRQALQSLKPEDRAQVEELLQFAPDTAGGLMQLERAQVKRNDSVDDAIARVRALVDDDIQVHGIFVVDDEEHLIGVIELARLLLNRGDKKVSEIMQPPVAKVTTDVDQEQ